ncbi:MAG: phosphatase PAP2 family protein [Dehalococcoidia bacterium]
MPSKRSALIIGGGAVLYCGAVTWYLLTHGGWPTPDFLIPPLLLLALLVGRGRGFLIDWTPFLVILLAWEATRGIADLVGMPVQVGGPWRFEEALFPGTIPTVTLQASLYDGDRGSRWFDWVGAILHSLHFALPIAFGFVLWLGDRAQYWRYVISVLLLFLLGFLGFVLFPQAPPWLAAGLIPDQPFIYRIGVGTFLSLPIQGHVGLVYDHIRPNDVAAMPSLHAALPALLTLILWRLKRPLAWVGVLYTATLAFFLVYQGEHYVIDIVVGWLLAALVFWLVWATPAWLRHRLPTRDGLRRRAIAIPATAIAGVILVVGTAAALRPNAFGSEPVLMLPPTPEPLVEEIQVLSGPCGISGSVTGVADALLSTTAGEYSAYLIEPSLGLCLALSDAQTIPPPDREEQTAFVREGGTPDAPVAGRGAIAGGMRLSAVGTPGDLLLAGGMPPGKYLLVVLLRDVPDAEVAREAAVLLGSYVLN